MSSSLRGSVLFLGLLLGCRTLGGPSSVGGAPLGGEEPDTAAEEAAVDSPDVRLALIARMIERGQLHAALAHLESLPAKDAALPAPRLATAEALRRLGRFAEAERGFRELLDTPRAAEAHRGLGLLEAARGDVGAAVVSLERARAVRPTDARIRNDLGYALLLAGRLGEAESELRTAVELGDDQRAVRNLVLLLFVRAEEGAALALAERSGLSSGSIGRIRARAAHVRRDAAREPSPGGAAS